MSLDFQYVYLGHSNLGGQGPDTSAPPTIRYINAASVFQPDVGTTYIDLEVSATSSYQPDEASLNGLSGGWIGAGGDCGGARRRPPSHRNRAR